MKLLLAGILALVALLGMTPAYAQVDSREGIALQNEILELRHEVQVLHDQLANGGGSSLGSARNPSPAPAAGGDITAALLDRVSRLEDQVRTLRGQLDEANNAMQQQNADLSKQIGDLDFKLGLPTPGSDSTGTTPGTGIGAPPPPAGGTSGQMSPPPGNLGAPAPPMAALPTPVAPPPAPPVRRTPELAMQQGSAALARRDYAAAEAAARDVLAVPRTPRANDAQFLLAQALAGRKDYRGAAVAYDDTYTRAPAGAHAQDSLLGLAGALTSIGENRAACATLDKMKAEFPSTRQDLREAVVAARGRAGCR